jgi:hypothetical protein
MTPDEQRVAIAKACGWKCNGDPDQLTATQGWQFAHQCVLSPEGKLVTHNSIPDYINDLNAMHEAEKVLTQEQMIAYSRHVGKLVTSHLPASRAAWMDFKLINSTAAQRSEAFIRTLNLWQETPTQPQ